MAATRRISTMALAMALVLMTLSGETLGELRVGFYRGKCRNNSVEKIVFDTVKDHFSRDPTLVAALVRMQFHDCWIRGCDASILLEGPNTEKSAGVNVGIRGYALIDAVKAALERACPGVVSCADIIVIATRVTVFLARGKWYDVETGRRDGTVSIGNEANSQLPGPNIPVPLAIQQFAAKGIGKEDFVLLLGGHTVGIAHCFFFQDRLYNFNNQPGRTDPRMSPELARKLKQTCPRGGDGSQFAFLDQSNSASVFTVGNGYFVAIRMLKGVLQIDQDLALDPATAPIVAKYSMNRDLFNDKFGDAMVKLGSIGVLTGNQGQIRRSCRSLN